MYHNRVIPCLLLDGQGLVKTVKFKDRRYLGDPINAVKIYNDSEVDELIFLDISATREKRPPNFDYLSKITQQCFMPVCYGGGVCGVDDISRLFQIGFEKVAINSALRFGKDLLTEASGIFGSQSIVGAMDVEKVADGDWVVKYCNGTEAKSVNPIEYAKEIESAGAGELLVNSIDRDGCMNGYDLELVSRIAKCVGIPIVACGGAGSLLDCKRVVDCGANAAAAGSLFVYWGRKHAVLINYPEPDELEAVMLDDHEEKANV